MNRKIIFAVVVTLVSLNAFAQAPPAKKGPTAKGPLSAQKAIPGAPDKALMRKVLDAWETMDVTKPARFYAKDADLLFFDVAPMKYTGWDEYAKGVQQLFADFQSIKMTIGDDARVYSRNVGALGVATARFDIVNKNGAAETINARWTVVWEKRGNNWLIVHEHVSAPLPMSPPAATTPKQ